ncbi:MAG: molybdopterin molybdotransferase MoeA [Propionibacteriaceae bacterium]|nr:molybdopterin molybdotransferase MoeA [Propionibacteriaceae bacterium]
MALFGFMKPAAAVEDEALEVPEVVEVEEDPPTLPEAPALDANGLRSVADHVTYLLSLVSPLRPFGMGLLEAWDQVMCEDIDSMTNVPPNNTSKVDGYAIRAADLGEGHPQSLELVEASARLAADSAAAVGAGDVLPRGATAVLPASFGRVEAGRVHIIDAVLEGDYVRAAGEHMAVGTRLLSQGDVLSDRAIGLMASAGIDRVLVRPRPRVVVVSSGAELVEPGSQVHHGEDTDSNSFMIAAAARAAGATVFRVALHSSDPEALRATITDQLIRADLLISTTSGRREDYEAVAQAMAELGLTDTVEVAMSPGRTQTFGLIGVERVPMVMLPGNPISAYVSFHAFVRPLIRRLAGASEHRTVVRAVAGTPLQSVRGLTRLLRGHLVTDSHAASVDLVSDPHAMAELSRSNALIVMDEDVENVNAGEHVTCWPLEDT